jgi:tetratricopeptide (TPR) repeat protein
VLGAAVIGGGGLAVWQLAPELLERRTERGVNPLRPALTSWTKQFPDANGTAKEFVVEGRKNAAQDTAASARKADAAFKKALLLEVGDSDAIAGYVENYAQLPAVGVDADNTGMAREAIDWVLAAEPKNADALRASGALHFATGAADKAIPVLKEALLAEPNNPSTLLWLARAELNRNAQETAAIVVRAQKASPKTTDGSPSPALLTVEGAARRKLFQFSEARVALTARLASDPANVGALHELAKLEVDLGNADAALAALATVLTTEEDDIDAMLQQAKILYQMKGDFVAADATLDRLLQGRQQQAGSLLVEALAHATIVKTRLNNVDKAIALGEQAVATRDKSPGALFALSTAYHKKGQLDSAEKALEHAVTLMQSTDTFYETVVRAELGYVQLEQAIAAGPTGSADKAIKNLQQVTETDPMNLRAHLILVAAMMWNEKPTPAMKVMRDALRIDPARDSEHRVLTQYPLFQSDLIPLIAVIHNAKLPKGDAALGSLRDAAEGAVVVAAGEPDAKATALFQKALAEDRLNHTALLYSGFLSFRGGRAAEAQKDLDLALNSVARRHPLTMLYAARSLLALGEPADAKKMLDDLIESEPTLSQAKQTWADIRATQKGGKDDAVATWRAILVGDPESMPAKRALSAL